MRLTKRVNGKRVEMTAKEDADTRAEWAENKRLAAIEAEKPQESTLEERVADLEVKARTK